MPVQIDNQLISASDIVDHLEISDFHVRGRRKSRLGQETVFAADPRKILSMAYTFVLTAELTLGTSNPLNMDDTNSRFSRMEFTATLPVSDIST